MTTMKIVVATHNQGKLREFRRALGAFDAEFVSAAELELEEPVEDGDSFTANALIKARAAASAGLSALADDSGLCVEALGGAPGIYSARWAGTGKNFAVAFERLQKELGASAEGARAAFVCVLAFCHPDGREWVAEGRVEGRLIFPPRGECGFGYDPIFVPDGDTRTFAEMSKDEKAAFSHRSRALDELINAGVFGLPNGE